MEHNILASVKLKSLNSYSHSSELFLILKGNESYYVEEKMIMIINELLTPFSLQVHGNLNISAKIS